MNITENYNLYLSLIQERDKLYEEHYIQSIKEHKKIHDLENKILTELNGRYYQLTENTILCGDEYLRIKEKDTSVKDLCDLYYTHSRERDQLYNDYLSSLTDDGLEKWKMKNHICWQLETKILEKLNDHYYQLTNSSILCEDNSYLTVKVKYGY